MRAAFSSSRPTSAARPTLWGLVLACLLTVACGKDAPPPEPVAESPTLEDRTEEILVLLEANKDSCLEHAQELIAEPANFKREFERAASVEIRGRRYRPKSIEVLTVAKALRGLADSKFQEVTKEHGSDRDYIARMNLLRRAEEKLCRTLENYASRGAPNESQVSRYLAEFLTEFKTLTRRFPVTDGNRNDTLAAYRTEIDEAKKAAKDEIDASREAKQLVEGDPFVDQATGSSFFQAVEVGPKPLSAAEVAAVGLAASYLEQGPRGWADRFTDTSEWAALDNAARSAELLARLGPNSGVRWSLQKGPAFLGDHAAVFHLEHGSGFDETVVLELVEANGEWRIDALATNFDQRAKLTGIGTVAGSSTSSPALPAPSAPGLPALAAVLLVLTMLPLAGSRWHFRPVLAGLAGVAVLALACSKEAPVVVEQAPVEEPLPALEGLGELAPLKTAIAQSGPQTDSPPFSDFASRQDAVGEVASLWQAQWRLQSYDLDGAEAALDALADSRRPLRHLLLARLSYYRGNLEGLEKAYTDAQARGIDHDGLRLEAALAYGAVGLDAYAEAMLDSVAEIGTRQSFPYFALARLHARNGRVEDAEEMFLSAWELAPLPRRHIFQDGALAWLATRPKVLAKLEVSSPTEPLVAPTEAASADHALPAGFESVISGELLQVAIGASELLVAGGAGLAPTTVRVAPASEIAERSQRAALATLERLDQSPAQLAVALTHPQAASAITTLAYANQWDRVLELTTGIDNAVDRVSPDVVKLRALALERRDRRDEARKLLLAQARSDRANKRRDPEMFFQLAELLARSGEYDLAIRLIERGNAQSTLFGRPYRARQIRLEKNLVADDNTYTGSGFELRYPRVSGPDYPVKVTKVLTAERRRLAKWIPLASDVPIKVDLYPFLDFMGAYGGAVTIVGLFDGRVRVPFADLHSLRPEIVSILSHELAHAMIAARTNDNAPKWFHEGLAQHIEMDQPLNPIPELAAKNRVLSLPVIEAILGGMAEAQYAELAYSQSVWAVHYIEAAFGVRGIHKLLDQFAQGATTAEAIEGAFGLTLAEFDRKAWHWCANEAPEAWKVDVRRYDRELNNLLVKQTPARRKDLPRLRRTEAPAQPKRKVSRAAMVLWHKQYKKEVQGVHATLLPVLTMGTGQSPWDHGDACSALVREMQSFRPKRGVLNTPDSALSQALIALYGSAERLGRSCADGKSSTTPDLVRETMANFQRANRGLAGHGLTQ